MENIFFFFFLLPICISLHLPLYIKQVFLPIWLLQRASFLFCEAWLLITEVVTIFLWYTSMCPSAFSLESFSKIAKTMKTHFLMDCQQTAWVRMVTLITVVLTHHCSFIVRVQCWIVLLILLQVWFEKTVHQGKRKIAALEEHWCGWTMCFLFRDWNLVTSSRLLKSEAFYPLQTQSESKWNFAACLCTVCTGLCYAQEELGLGLWGILLPCFWGEYRGFLNGGWTVPWILEDYVI